MSSNVIEIPLKSKQNEIIELNLDELPLEAQDIINILRDEEVPLDLWLKFALEYYRRSRPDAFQDILNAALSPDLSYIYSHQRREKISILNALAAYYIAQGAKEKDKQARAEILLGATTRFNEADLIDVHELITWLGKGIMLFTKGDLKNAAYQFNYVLAQSPKNVPAIVGKACISFNQKEYIEALNLYQKAVSLLPSQASFRLGIGLCYYKLGELAKARDAFNRVLEMEPKNVDAMSFIIVMDMNSGEPAKMKAALQMLKVAYDLDPQNPTVLNCLANHFFHRKDFNKTQVLATTAYQQSEVDSVKAESCYYIAKSHHARDEFDLAFQYYYQALQLDPDLLLARFGLGQMWIFKGNMNEARSCFEKVLEKEPQTHETMKILGSLLAKEKNVEERLRAEKFLTKVVEANPNDVEAWIELGEIQEKIDIGRSLKSYQKSAEIWGNRGNAATLPPELLNNIGSLHHRQGAFETALGYFEKALAICQNTPEEASKEEKENSSLTVTLRYNRARVWEDLNLDEKAKEAYLELTREHPGYLDCYLRLGCISMKLGNLSESNDWFGEVLNIDKDNANAWTLMGIVHMKKNEWKPCQKKFERILKNTDKHDLYSLVTLGNVLLRSLKYETSKQQVEQGYRRAIEYFHKALTLDNHNVYAANGLGVVFAEKGHFNQAKDVFIKVREAIGDFPDAWTNLAHMYSEMGQHTNAIKLYEGCSKRFFDNKDVPTLIYIARAYYNVGREQKDVDQITKCRKYLEKALLLRPWDHSIRFNIALAQQESAFIVLRKTVNERTLKQVKQAQEQIQSAHAIFRYLGSTTPYPKNSYEPKMAEERARYCAESLASLAKKHLEKQIASEKGKEDQFLTLEQKRLASEEEERRRLEEIQREKERQEAEVERKRLELSSLAMEAVSKTADMAKETPKGKRKRHDSDSEGEKSGDDDDDGGEGSTREGTPKPKKSKQKKEKRAKEDQGEKEKKKKKKKTKRSDSKSRGDDDQEEDPEETRKRGLENLKNRRSKKRKETDMNDVIDSDEDRERPTSQKEDEDGEDREEGSQKKAKYSSGGEEDEGRGEGEGEGEEVRETTRKRMKKAVVDDDEEEEQGQEGEGDAEGAQSSQPQKPKKPVISDDDDE